MDDEDPRVLLKSVLGYLAQKQPDRSTSASPQSQALDAWVRTDSYLQHETNDFDDYEAAQVKRILKTFENFVPYDSDLDADAVRTFLLSKSYHYNPQSAIDADPRTMSSRT